MASPFPELPRLDCQYVPTVEAISGPMLPKPMWDGASSYSDPNYPSGGGPDDVPPAPPPMGQALPASNISPPTQTMMGGGGGSFSLAQATADGTGGTVTVRTIQHLVNLSASPNFEQTGETLTVKYFKL